MKGHWSHTCRTPIHLVDFYQASIKGKEVEMNFIGSDGQVDITHLDVSDFFENPNGKIDHLISDVNVMFLLSFSQIGLFCYHLWTHCLLFILYSLFHILSF